MSFHIPTSLAPTHVIAGVISVLVIFLVYRRRTSNRDLPYPPGPRPLPLIGNILDMPPSKVALAWSKLGEEYGPLTWLTIPGQRFLIINSFEAAKELLEKRTLNYIDRPRFTMANELLGLSNYIALSVANDKWKRGRAHLKHALSGPVVKANYSSLLETKARQYLERLIARPENAVFETNRVVGEVIVKLSFGKLEDGPGRDYIQIITRLMEIMAPTMQGYVVDLFPALQYLPKWLPGMKFKRDAARMTKEIRELEGTVFELMQENAVSNDPDVRSSFTFRKMQEIDSKYGTGQDDQRYADEKALRYSGLQMFFAGLETTESTVQTFILAMILFPAVRKKAQAEIDKVVGPNRLPTLQDQSDLPFLHAIVLETLRWGPTVSFGLPHVSRQDDVYNGYFIPKGTTVMANVWGFTRNSQYYSNPSTFDPERYLKQPPELDPREYAFGYGRRICPGKDLAFQEIWILAASVLWAFDVVGLDDELASLADDDRFSFATASRPTSLKCRFVPRREGLKDKLGLATD